MEPRERKKWNPDCPGCQEEMRRHIELWKAVFDEVDHGVAKGAQFRADELYCDHESGKER